MRKLLVFLGICCCAYPLTLSCAAPQYRIIDLGTLGGDKSSGVGLNSLNQVVGESRDPDYSSHAFLWLSEAAYGLGPGMHDLGCLGGQDMSGSTGINDSGQVVGFSMQDVNVKHGFLWQNGVMYDLGTLGGTDCSALAINNAGQIVGYADPLGQEEANACLWENGTAYDLGTLGGLGSLAADINESGAIAGRAGLEDGSIHACFWENGVIADIGTFGGIWSSGEAINDLDQVVGFADYADGTRHAFLYENGELHDLGTLGGVKSSAFGINNSGWIVGRADDSEEDTYATLWADGAIMNLNDLLVNGDHWELYQASMINEAGCIVGSGYYRNDRHAYLLVLVPEPGVTVVALLGFAALVLWRRCSLLVG